MNRTKTLTLREWYAQADDAGSEAIAADLRLSFQDGRIVLSAEDERWNWDVTVSVPKSFVRVDPSEGLAVIGWAVR